MAEVAIDVALSERLNEGPSDGSGAEMGGGVCCACAATYDTKLRKTRSGRWREIVVNIVKSVVVDRSEVVVVVQEA